MSEILKPCPFCGREARIREVSIGDSYDGFTVECRNCAVDIGNIDTKEEAIEKWNNRWMIPCEEGETEGNWHTGTPTEEGWYLFATKNKNYISYKATDIKCEAHLALVKEIIKPYKIVAWMPIPPYEASTILLRKENEDGHTD